MLHHHSGKSSHNVIELPRCPKCQIRMMLVGVELGFAGPDLRTFECPRCELEYKALADYEALAEDPMGSKNALGWMNSELRPPE